MGVVCSSPWHWILSLSRLGMTFFLRIIFPRRDQVGEEEVLAAIAMVGVWMLDVGCGLAENVSQITFTVTNI
eukprot:scaffold4344_cov75-Cyclotella_meneghiniana.AAC.7